MLLRRGLSEHAAVALVSNLGNTSTKTTLMRKATIHDQIRSALSENWECYLKFKIKCAVRFFASKYLEGARKSGYNQISIN